MANRQPIIDSDVHPYIAGGLHTLLDYVPRSSRGLLAGNPEPAAGTDKQAGPKTNPPNRHPHPMSQLIRSSLRPDARPPSGDLPGTDPKFVASELFDRFNVAAGVLLPVAPAGGGQFESTKAYFETEAGVAYVSAVNRYFTERWLSVDPRFGYAVLVFAKDTTSSVAEIKRHQGTAGVLAVSLSLAGELMGDRHYYPIYEVAQQYDLPVLVHPAGAEGQYIGAQHPAGGMPAYWVERRGVGPLIGQANAASLILNGVFERFPKLRVVFVEYGFSWVAPLMWRMDREWVDRRAGDGLRRKPSEYLIDRIRFTTQPIEEPEKSADMLSVLEMMEASQTLLFSSDYPHWDNDVPQTVLAHLPEELQRRIYYDNALDSFGPRLSALLAKATPALDLSVN